MVVLVISVSHILILVVALVILFGGKKIPELMGGIGKGMKEFKKAMKDEEEQPKETPKQIPSASNKKEPLKD